MLLHKEKAPTIDYKANWPAHYYDIPDIDTREKLLLEMVEVHSKALSSGRSEKCPTEGCLRCRLDESAH